MKHKNQKGFTLLELMVTVAIVGILAAIAIPIYNNYITKTRIADALTHGRVYAGKVTIDKEDVVEAPSDLEYSEINLEGQVTKPQVRIKLKETIDSTVLMSPDDRAGGKVIVLSEQSSDASVRWACTTNLPQALIPTGCDYDASVKDRKLLEEWAEGKGDACWSNARDKKTGNGWSIGSCTHCVQATVQTKAQGGYRPGVADAHGLACSGLYGGDEALAEAGGGMTGSGGGDAVAEATAAADVGGPADGDPFTPDLPEGTHSCWSDKLAASRGDGNGWAVGPVRSELTADQQKGANLAGRRGTRRPGAGELMKYRCRPAGEAKVGGGDFGAGASVVKQSGGVPYGTVWKRGHMHEAATACLRKGTDVWVVGEIDVASSAKTLKQARSYADSNFTNMKHKRRKQYFCVDP
jgi:type IV pilus assembly protein PilA